MAKDSARLTKSVCMNCTKHHDEDLWGQFDYDFSGTAGPLGEKGIMYDDDLWEMGLVVCPEEVAGDEFLDQGDLTSIKKDPPRWCPYKFQHGVALGMHDG